MNYQIIFIPIIAALSAQIIKMIIKGAKDKFSWRDLVSYGGMPSSHAALVISLTLMAGLSEGWNSAAFAISLILAIIIIRDAGGYRQDIGRHAKELNQIINNLSAPEASKFSHLNERIGHTSLELFFGCLLGILVVIGYILIF